MKKAHSRLASTNKPAINIMLKPTNRGLTYLEGFREGLVKTRRLGIKPVIDSRPGHTNLVGEVRDAQDFYGVVHCVLLMMWIASSEGRTSEKKQLCSGTRYNQRQTLQI